MRNVAVFSFLLGLTIAVGCSPSSEKKASVRATAGELGGSVEVSAPGGGASDDASATKVKITFVGSKAEGKHDGGFKKLTVSAPKSDDVSKTQITVDIETDSIYTDEPKLTTHLKSPDFFDVKTYPAAKFVSTSIKPVNAADSTYTVTGDLTLHGTTKPLTIPVKITKADGKLNITGEFTINRQDYGIKFGKGKVYDEVPVKVELSVDQK